MAKLQPDYIKWVLTLNATQAQEEYHKLEKANRELQAQSRESRKAMTELEAQGKKGSKEWINHRNSVRQATTAMSENRKKMAEVSRQFDLNSMTVNQLSKRLRELKREFNNTSRATDPQRYRELQTAIDNTKQAIYKATQDTEKLHNAFISLPKLKQTLIGFFNGIGMSVINLVVGSFRDAFNIVVDFEKANSRLASILGTTKDGIKELEAGARQLGGTTSYSAAEVTGLQIELAKLGFVKDDILNMEAGVLKFAKAVDTDLPRASAFAGAALRIFGKDAADTESVLASFALATSKSALDFSFLESALSTIGPVANSFGFSLEDTVALLGQLANAGFDASSAATATRNILLKLCDSSSSLAQALGTPVKNADDLAKGLKKLQDEGVDLNKALELTDKRSVAAFSKFIQSANDIVPLRDAISDCTDEFNEMSKTMGDNVAGAMAGLRSASEELVLKIAEGTQGPIKDLINALTTLVQWIGEGIDYTRRYSSEIKVIAAAFLSYKGTMLAVNAVIKSYNLIVKSAIVVKKTLKAAVTALSGAFKSYSTAVKNASAVTKAFGALSSANFWSAFISVVMSLVVAYITLRKETDELTNTTKKLNEIKSTAIEKAEEEKYKINELVAAAKNENLAMRDRITAINELNKIIPGYNAQLDKTTGKYVANAAALNTYINSLVRKYELEGAKEMIIDLSKKRGVANMNLANAQNDAKYWDNQRSSMSATSIGGSVTGYVQMNTDGVDQHRIQAHSNVRKYQSEVNGYDAQIEKIKAHFGSDLMQQEAVETVTEVTNTINNATNKATGHSSGSSGSGSSKPTVDSELDKARDEWKRLRMVDPMTEEEYDFVTDQQEELVKKIEKLKAKSKKELKGAHLIDEATVEADEMHQSTNLAINQMKDELNEVDFIIKKNEEVVSYNKDLLKVLRELRGKTASTDKETLDAIAKTEYEAGQNMFNAHIEINKATIEKEAQAHQQRLDATKAFYDAQNAEIKKQLDKGEITEGQADIYLQRRSLESHNARLKELEDYYRKVEKADYIGKTQKMEMLDSIKGEINSVNSQILTDTAKWHDTMRSLINDTTSARGITHTFKVQRKNLEATYDTMIKLVKDGSQEQVALEREKLRRLAALDFQYREQMWQLKEITGLSWDDEYSRELDKLKNYHDQGLISESAYQKRKLEIGINNAKKYFDYYGNLSSSMFTAIQDAEIASSDAKYDVLIQQAKNNGDDTAALEQEKENRKLEIQKKYADVNFAIKVSQIVADTAVSIMKAFADLGPVGGAIAAAMLTATGAAQVVSANAEREKVKQMQPGVVSPGSAASSSPAQAERVLKGYALGGYTGDGGRYEVAGIVHRGEYVVPKPIMDNPRVVDAVGTIEAIRRGRGLASGDGRSSIVGYADGGRVEPLTIDFTQFEDAVKVFKTVASNLKATVQYKDYGRAKYMTELAQSPFTKRIR